LRATALVDQAIVSATSILTVVILARFAGSEQLGLYSLAMTAVFMTLAVQESLITAPYMVYINLKGLRGSSLRRYTGSVLTQSVALGFLATSLLATVGVASAALGYSSTSRIALVLSAAVVVILLRELARRDCLARSRMLLLLLIDAVAASAQVGLLLAVGILYTLDATVAIVLLALAASVAFAIWIAVAHSAISFDRRSLRAHTIRSWLFGRWVLWCSLATVANHYCVHWILAIGAGPAATGAFEAIRALASLINPMINGLRNIVGPLGARRISEAGVRAARHLVTSTTRLIAAIGTVWLAVLYFAGGWLLTIVYGQDFSDLGTVLLITAASFVMFGLGVPADQGLWAVERPEINAYAATASLVVTIAVSLLLFPVDPLLAVAMGLLAGKTLEVLARGVGFLRVTSSRAGTAT
jgi:O-antigen/teichoic acid export membrane protein